MSARAAEGLLALALAVLAACRESPAVARAELPLKRPPGPTGPAISAGDLMTRLYAFADDSMQGREAGTEGNLRATAYLAAEAARIGLVPAGEHGSYFQTLPLARRGVDASRSRLAPESGAPLVLWRDYAPVVRGGTPRAVDGAAAVFGGRVAPDGTVGLTPAAAAGRFVVILPREGDAAGRLSLAFAATRGPLSGAAGVAVVVTDEALADVGRWAGRWDVRMARAADTVAVPSFFLVTRGAAERLLGAPLEGRRAGAPGGAVRGTPAFVNEPAPARNVVAVLPGSDPRLRGQYVALGAHSDHIGLGAPVDHDSLRLALADRAGRGGDPARARAALDSVRRRRPPRADSVNNGADDDGSGSVALLEIAEALAASSARPRRSVLFVWHTAEELGMVGSRWFTDHPTVPLDSIVAQINVDMIGRGGADDVPGGGPRFLQVVGARRLSRELGDLVEAVNRARAEPLALDWSWDAPTHPERIYCRSDHYMYALHGIPVAFFMTGLHRDYHQPTDEPQYIDYGHLVAVTDYVRELVARIANRDHRPLVDGNGEPGC
ncbi:MAG: M28 family metallopeptidase [Gemmatimonadaceae bacterium]